MTLDKSSQCQPAPQTKRIIKPAEAYKNIGISSSEGERRVISDPYFPQKVRLGPRSVGFVLAEVEAYIDHLIAASRPRKPRPTCAPAPIEPHARPVGKPQAVGPQSRPTSKPESLARQRRPTGAPEPVAPKSSGSASGEVA